MRSSTVNIGDFDGLVVTPITSRSTNFAPRRIISMWPRVMGSNVPGYTPTRTFDSVISDLFQSHNLLSRAADRPRPHKCANGLWPVEPASLPAHARVQRPATIRMFPSPRPHPCAAPCPCVRSEEHTSELQSLMRISYAVFCL